MSKEEWGTKRLCPHCATRFFDLRKDPMTCPACGAQFSADSLIEGRGKTAASEKTQSRAKAAPVDDTDEEDVDNDSNDLDDDLLEDDDDDGDVSLDDIADVAESDED